MYKQGKFLKYISVWPTGHPVAVKLKEKWEQLGSDAKYIEMCVSIHYLFF